ncbi:MAG: HDOD domain-containing protein [Burkholderiales bacterium]|nr:HDOD domain-containing protein [Burkholderiales bacterium]
MPDSTPYLTEPLADLAAWTRYFCDAEIPVLATTSQALEVLRAIEDDVDAAMLTEAIQPDPLMTIKLMAYAAKQRRPGDFTETESITSALVMTGIAPFFRHFGLQPTIEDRLHDQPEALAGLRELLQRAERARLFALGFAVHRNDLDVDVIQRAAFLHDFAEMLMWCHAPTLELQIRNAQKADPSLRSASIQQSLLHIELDDLALALMKLWHLPSLLVRISDTKHADQANVRNVVLAVRVARHTMHGWDNPALPDDVNDIAELLNAAPRIALAYLHKIDTSVA